MNTNWEALYLFLIMVLGLLLCSFLGGNCYSESFTNNNTQGAGTNNNGPNNNKGPNNSGPSSSNDNLSKNKSTGYDNYNHYSGSSTQLANGTTFTGPNGGTVTVQTASDGSQSLQVTSTNGGTPVTFTSTKPSTTTTESMTTYSGNNGCTATMTGGGGWDANTQNINPKSVIRDTLPRQ